MTTITTITTLNAPRSHPRSCDDENDSFSGCFGILRLRSSSPSLRSQQSRSEKSTPPRPRYTAAGPAAVWDGSPASGSDLKGYSIAGKSAEILGLTPKAGPASPHSRTSSPVPWRSLSGNDVSSSQSRKGSSSLRSQVSSSSFDIQRWPVATATKKAGPVDPLDAVRRRLREETAPGDGSTSRSSSAPAPTRNYSRKWRKSHRVEAREIESMPRTSADSGKDFFDATSTYTAPIEEDEIPDTNKFDKLALPIKEDGPTTSQRSSARIRSAAYTTFAWIEQQEALGRLSTPESSRGSWLLVDEKLPSPTGNTANDSKKRSAHVPRSSAGSDESFKKNDKRDTLEWMGVKPGDFPVPVITVVA